MEGKEIYLVVGDEGEASGHVRWVLAGWSSEESAEQHVALAKQMQKRLRSGAPLTAEDVAIDPVSFGMKTVGEVMHKWALGGEFSVEAVRLDPDLPEVKTPGGPITLSREPSPEPGIRGGQTFTAEGPFEVLFPFFEQDGEARLSEIASALGWQYDGDEIWVVCTAFDDRTKERGSLASGCVLRGHVATGGAR